MTQKRKNVFRIMSGFRFGIGFMLAAYLVMFFMDGLGDFLVILIRFIMKSAGAGV